MCLGIPGKLLSIDDDQQQRGTVDVGGIQREVDLSCVVQAGSDIHQLVGQWALIHVGFAMSIIDESEAQATLAVLEELGEMQDELTAMSEGAS